MNYYLKNMYFKKHLKMNFGQDLCFEGCKTSEELMEMIRKFESWGCQCETIEEGEFYFVETDNEQIFYFLGDKIVLPADCSYMFKDVVANMFDFSNFDCSNVCDASFMFCGAEFETLNLSNFDTSNLKNVRGMFRNASISILELSNFNTSNIEEMSEMFWGFSSKSLDLSSFNMLKVSKIDGFFTWESELGKYFSILEGDKLNKLIINDTFVKRGLINDSTYEYVKYLVK